MIQDSKIASEQAVLGSIQLDSSYYHEAAKSICAEDFALSADQLIFRRAGDMIARGEQAEQFTLAEELDRHGELSSIGGKDYLLHLREGLTWNQARAGIAGWIRSVAEAAKRRRVQKALASLATSAEDPGEDVDEILARGISQMLELQSSKDDSEPAAAIISVLDRMQQEHTRKSELLGLPTGLQSLDRMTCGMQASEIIILGARSGVGKSAFMIQAAIANCRAGNRVLIFSLEMTREQVYRRIFASVAGVPFARVRDPKWATDHEMAKIRYAAEQVLDWPLEIDPSGAIHIDKLIAKARYEIPRKGVQLVCVDYAQIVPADGRDERLRVAAVSRGLTRLAKDEGVPVLLLSQLSRPDKSNANRRPRLSDLRETSQLENDANVAVLLHRPVDDEEQFTSEAELIVAKQRSGATGIFPLEFNQTTLTFEERKNSASRQAAAS